MTQPIPAHHLNRQRCRDLARDERGLSTVEYVIILLLIAAAAVGTWRMLGGTITSKLGDATTTIRDMDGTGTGTAQGQSQSSGNATAPATPAASRASGKVAD